MKILKNLWDFLVDWAIIIAESKRKTVKNGYNGYY